MLVAGSRIGAYEVTSVLGIGGMGEVYRARDRKLGRDVAIKVLPQLSSHDPDRLARFQREAQTLAALNHPHIASIYGLEENGPLPAIVMELVDGPTLEERLAPAPLPLHEALGIALQIADALEAAHNNGIIHRDLKPANIKLTPGGAAKVLDFGVAKVVERSDLLALADAPTVSALDSDIGVVLGTAAYMSPEQARGETVDHRSDIWAFGAVLFEMLTGQRSFPGRTSPDALAAVLRGEPDWRLLPAGTPRAIRRLLGRCLAKDRRNRFQHAGDIRLEIADLLDGGASDDVAPSGRAGLPRMTLAATALVLMTATAAGVVYVRSPAVEEQRFEINTPPTTAFSSFAISPDGRTLVFVAASQGRRQLWLRDIAALEARPLPGTEGALNPFWAPNGRAIGFFADGKLKRIDRVGGSPEIVANAPVSVGGAWNEAGVILFGPAPGQGLHRVNDTGGEPAVVTRLDTPRQVNHTTPIFLPDSDRFLFFVQGAPTSRGVYLGSLGSGSVSRLFDADGPAAFLAPDRILFIQEGTLFARRFDLGTLKPIGEPVPIAKNVATVTSSASRVIVYRSVPAEGVGPRLQLHDRAGRLISTHGELQALSAELSPDGSRVAMHRQVAGNIDVWVLDFRRNIPTRLTSAPPVEGFVVWSPNAQRLAYSTSGLGLSVIAATGVGGSSVLWKTDRRPVPVDWSPDGKFVLVRVYRAAGGADDLDIHALQVDSDSKLIGDSLPLADSQFDEREARFSPDGRWIAYQSDETGRFEIYLRPFPGPGEKIRVTTAGGIQVRWPRRQGKELFYLALDGTLMTVPVTLSAPGSAPDVGVPHALFSTNILTAANRERLRQEYDVSPDGQLILMSEVAEWQTPLTIVQNWTEPANE
jgi:Tol biopolymer transport system component